MKRKQIKNVNDFEVIKCRTDEKETTIVIDHDTNKATIYTSSNTMLTKLKKKIAKGDKSFECFEGMRNKNGEVTGYFFETNAKNINIRDTRDKRELSDEERAVIRERFMKNRAESV